MILSLSAVSAAETNDTSGEIMQDPDAYQTPAADSSQNISTNSEGDGTFSDLSSLVGNASAGATIALDKNYSWDGSGNFSGIVLDKTITIDGQGHTIDAESSDGGHVRMFNIYGTDIVLKNIVFANGDRNYGSVGGGAIYIFEGATVAMINCTFVNNIAAFGGAINSYGGLNLTNCTFINNSAKNNAGAVVGSAQTGTNGPYYLNIINSKFYNNSANFGGAILGGYESLVSIVNSEFINNTAAYNGAALDFSTYGSVSNITNCTFIGNKARNGAVVNLETTAPEVALDNCVIINNTATNNGAVLYGNYAGYPTYSASLNNCTMIGNNATNGAIVYISDNLYDTTVSITNSKMVNNTAQNNVIAYMSEGSELAIADSNLTNNTATNNNALISYDGATTNSFITSFTELANAINSNDNTILLTQSITMTDEEATTYANGISINRDITINGMGNTIDANNLARIFNIANGITVTLNNVVLINGNSNMGAAIHNNGNLTVIGSTLKDNTASYWGGAIYNNGTLTVRDSIFDGNDIAERISSPGNDPTYGGAAIFNNYDSILTVDNSAFTNNINNYQNGDYISGAITTYSNATITNSYFENNSGRYGGAVSGLGDGTCKLTVDNSAFVNNRGLYGAGINIQDIDFSITNSEFVNQTAFGKGDMTPNNNNGGAICIYGNTTGVIDNSTFIGNEAQWGGAISISENNGIVISNSSFTNNTATYGGAMDAGSAVAGPNNISIINSTFEGNAASYGGAIFNNEEMNVTDSEFINNTAAVYGSALYNMDELTLTGSNSFETKDGIDPIYNNNDLSMTIEDFNDLDNAISLVDGVLTLQNNILISDDEADAYAEGIAINKDITIDGNGHTIDANNLARIFNIAEGVTVTLNNINLVNGNASYGGAILNKGTLTIRNANLTDNTATSNGGAIYNNGTATIDSTNIAGNDIATRDNPDYYGGAGIYNAANATVTITNSNFENNLKDYENGDRVAGGALENFGNVTIINTTFVNNSGRWGGAIYSYVTDDDVYVIVLNSTFLDNAALYGAGMEIQGGDFAVDNSKFINNTAFGKGDVTPNNNNGGAINAWAYSTTTSGNITDSVFTGNIAHYGGAVSLGNVVVNIENSTFTDNNASYGGAISISINAGTPDVTIVDSEFSNNAAYIAGAIYNLHELEVANTTFVNNTAQILSGAIYSSGSLTVTESVFDGNEVTNPSSGYGAAAILNNNRGTMVIDNSTFVNHVASEGNLNYGAITSTGPMNITDSYFENNSAYRGGALSVVGGNTNVIDNCTFVENGGYVGAVYVTTRLSVSNSTFINNTGNVSSVLYNSGVTVFDSDNVVESAEGSAVPIYNRNNVVLEINNFTDLANAIELINGMIVLNNDVTISDEEAERFKEGINITKSITIYGFGNTVDARNLARIFNIAEGVTVTLNNINLVNGNASYGGAVYNNGTLRITNANLTNNTAVYRGGAVYNKGTATVVSSNFEDNDISTRDTNAYYGGAAIFNEIGSTLNVSDSVFDSNLKNYVNGDLIAGGAIANRGYAQIKGSTFTNNSGRWGGAIFSSGINGNENRILIVDNCTFEDNIAIYGAGIELQYGIFSVNNSKFINNSALGKGSMTPNDNNGGAINAWGETAEGNITNSVFVGNSAQYGGAIDLGEGKYFIIENCTLENNTADASGGAIQMSSTIGTANVTVINSSFINNDAGKQGGAIRSLFNLTVIDSEFVGNEVQGTSMIYLGGAIYSGANLTVVNSEFEENYAARGGAIYGLGTSDVLVENSTFTNNSAHNYGAAIVTYGSKTNLVVNGSSFDGNRLNSAAGNGVVLYVRGDTAVDNSNFTNNKATIGGSASYGAIYSYDGSLSVNNSLFENNSAKNGAAIYVGRSSDGVLVDSSVFIGNNGTQGAISNNRNNLVVMNSNFTNNTGDSASAIYNTGTLTTSNSEFVTPEGTGPAIYNSNDVDINITNFTDLAFAVDNVANILTLHDNITITDEEAERFKEGINITKSITIEGNGVTVDARNLARIFNIAEGVTVTLNNINLVNGNASYGGAVYNKGNLTIEDSVDLDSSAANAPVYNAGELYMTIETFTDLDNAIKLVDGVLTLQSDVVADKGNFGGIKISKPITIDGNGHTISAGDYTNVRIFTMASAGIVLENIVFADANRPTTGGAVMYIHNGDEVTVVNSTFVDNSALAGGAIYIQNGGKLTVIDSTFVNNTAQNGAAIESEGTLIVEGSTFTGGEASDHGGAVSVTGTGSAEITDSKFSDNDAVYGGAIVAYTGAEVEITGSEFANNTGSTTGGAIFMFAGSHVSVDASNFTDNTAAYGGAIDNHGALDISNSIFESNIATTNGGAIFTQSGDNPANDYYTNITNSKFINNSANYGGAIVAMEESVLTVDSSEFINNSAKANGGAIEIYYSDVVNTVTNSNFTGNDAQSGSAVYALGSTPSVELEGNSYVYEGTDAPIYGNGDLFVSQAVITVLNNETVEATWGETVTLTATVTVDGAYVSSNTVYFTVNGESIKATNLGNGSYSASYVVDVAGTNIVSASINDVENTVLNGTVEVAKLNTTITIDVNDTIVVDDVAVVTGSITSTATGNVLIYVNGELNGTAAIADGKFSYEFTPAAVGEYAITAVYEGSASNNNATSNAVSLEVVKHEITSENVSVVFTDNGKDSVVTVTLPEKATGTVIINVDGTKYEVDLVDGVATATIADVTSGKHFYTVDYSGDDKFESYNGDMDSFTKSALLADIEIGFADGNAIVTVDETATGSVTLYINGTLHSVADVENGQAVFDLSALTPGDYEIYAVYSGDEYFANATAEADYNVPKYVSDVTVSVDSVIFGNDVIIIATVNSTEATGNVTFTVGDKVNVVQIVDGKATITLEGLAANTYTVTATYSGDKNFTDAFSSADFEVAKAASSVTVDVEDVSVAGETVTIVATVPNGTGNVTFRVNNAVIGTAAVVNGKASVTYTPATSGEFTVEVTYNGDGNYNASSAATEFDVGKIPTNPEIVVTPDTTTTVEIGNLPAGLTGITVTVDGNRYAATYSNGKYVATVTNLAAGTHSLAVSYPGNDVYAGFSETDSFTVTREAVDINLGVTVSEDDATVNVRLPSDATGSVVINVDGTPMTVPLTGGSASVTLEDLSTGRHTVTVTYAGDSKYANASKSTVVTITVIKSVLTADNLVMLYRDGSRFYYSLTDINGNPIANKVIQVTINGVTYNREIGADGRGSMAINLNPGVYGVYLEYSDGEVYTSVSDTANVTVVSSIEGNDIVKYYKNGTQYYATFWDSDGSRLANTNVTFNINGVYYIRQTNEDGVARLNINLNPGEYIITAISPVNGQQYSNTVTVLPTVIGEDIVKYYKNGTQYHVLVLDDQGNPVEGYSVQININGVFYYRTTDEYGIATLAINLSPGEYIATAYARGLATSNIVTVLPTLYGQDLVKSYNEPASYNVTAVDSQGNPVVGATITMNINGVFYQRVTDEDGIARLNINLLPGRYIITSEYAEFMMSNTVTVV